MRAGEPIDEPHDVEQAVLARFAFASRAVAYATIGVCLLDLILTPPIVPQTLPFRLFNLGVALAFRFAERAPSLQRHASAIGVALLLAMASSSLLNGVSSGRLRVSAFLVATSVVVASAMVPWGARSQAVLASSVALLIGGSAWLIDVPQITPVECATVFLTLVLSVFIARDRRRGWDDGQRRTAQLAAEIADRRRAEQQMALLVDIVSETTGTLDRGFITRRIQERTAEALHADIVLNFNLDPVQRRFYVTAHHGIPPDLRAFVANLTFSMREPFGGRLSAGETVVVDDLEAWPGLPVDMLKATGLRALIATPLIVGGSNSGRFVALRRGEPYTTLDRTLFEGIARHLAVALEAADLYRLQAHEARSQQQLARLSRALLATRELEELCTHLDAASRTMIGAHGTCTFLVDGDDMQLQLVHSGGAGAEAWDALRDIAVPRDSFANVLERLESESFVEVADSSCAADSISRRAAELGVHSILYLPLRRDSRVVAVHAAWFTGDATILEPRRRTAGTLAQLGSFAVANTQLLDELDRANRVKSDFVATMSHELRSPLNVIIGYNDLLLDGVFGPLSPEQIDTLQRTQRRAWELLELINTTLDLSRMAAGRMALAVSEVDVAELLSQIDVETRDLRAAGQVEFHIQLAAGLPTPRTDGPKLKVVLKNLVRNALKFTERGAVDVRAEVDGGSLRFTVTDTGPGIPPTERDAIFEAFRQLDSSITRRFGGAGLGLYIVRQLLEVLQGRITLDSEVGKGSTFRVWIPLSPDATAEVLGEDHDMTQRDPRGDEADA